MYTVAYVCINNYTLKMSLFESCIAYTECKNIEKTFLKFVVMDVEDEGLRYQHVLCFICVEESGAQIHWMHETLGVHLIFCAA